MLAAVLVVAAVVVAAPGVAGAQAGIKDTARAGYERAAVVQAELRRRARAERHRRMERARAHARMPSTLYASTLDRALPPHPAPAGALATGAKRAAGHAVARVSAKSVVGQAHRIAFFPSASRWGQMGYRGFARLVNRTGEIGEVRIEAWDDAGVRHRPLVVSMGAG